MGPNNNKFEKRNDLLKIFQLKNFIIKNKPINEIIHINQTINIGLICRFFENSVEWDKVMPLVDNVNLMTYEFYGSGSKQTGHHTALGSADFDGRSAFNSIDELIS